MFTLREWAKNQILADFDCDVAIVAAIAEGRLSFGSTEANRRSMADYEAKISELLTVIQSW